MADTFGDTIKFLENYRTVALGLGDGSSLPVHLRRVVEVVQLQRSMLEMAEAWLNDHAKEFSDGTEDGYRKAAAVKIKAETISHILGITGRTLGIQEPQVQPKAQDIKTPETA